MTEPSTTSPPDANEEDPCGICQEEMRIGERNTDAIPVTLRCRHKYHASCIRNYVLSDLNHPIETLSTNVCAAYVDMHGGIRINQNNIVGMIKSGTIRQDPRCPLCKQPIQATWVARLTAQRTRAAGEYCWLASTPNNPIRRHLFDSTVYGIYTFNAIDFFTLPQNVAWNSLIGRLPEDPIEVIARIQYDRVQENARDTLARSDGSVDYRHMQTTQQAEQQAIAEWRNRFAKLKDFMEIMESAAARTDDDGTFWNAIKEAVDELKVYYQTTFGGGVEISQRYATDAEYPIPGRNTPVKGELILGTWESIQSLPSTQLSNTDYKGTYTAVATNIYYILP